MNDCVVEIREAMEEARRLLYPDPSCVEGYSIAVDGVWTMEYKLTSGWLITHGQSGDDWYLSLTALEWNEVRKLQAIKLRSRSQTLTFKLGDIERHLDGSRLGCPMRMIGDQG